MEEEGRSSSLVSAELPSQSPASPPLLTEGTTRLVIMNDYDYQKLFILIIMINYTNCVLLGAMASDMENLYKAKLDDPANTERRFPVDRRKLERLIIGQSMTVCV